MVLDESDEESDFNEPIQNDLATTEHVVYFYFYYFFLLLYFFDLSVLMFFS